MDYRPLGRTGLQVSALGYGCGAVGGLMTKGDPAEQRRAVERALAAGITYFDTAPSYGNGASEQNLGRVLRELGAWDRVRVGTKVQVTAAGNAAVGDQVRQSIEQSLARLNRESVDLLQLHSRVTLQDGAGGVSIDRVLGEVVPAMMAIREAGLVRHLGFTGMGDTPAVLRAVEESGLETVQSYFNAVNASAGYAGCSSGQQDFSGLIDRASVKGLGVIGIRVMAAGALREERHANAAPLGFLGSLVGQHDTQQDLRHAARLEDVVRDGGLDSVFELAFRFALAKPGLSTALIGFSSFEQLEQAIAWAERGALAPELVRRVVDLAR